MSDFLTLDLETTTGDIVEEGMWQNVTRTTVPFWRNQPWIASNPDQFDDWFRRMWQEAALEELNKPLALWDALYNNPRPCKQHPAFEVSEGL